MNKLDINDSPQVKRVKVILKRPHTHAGVEYDEVAVAAGVEIAITEDQAQWLKDLGII
jgi:hypothetical protein